MIPMARTVEVLRRRARMTARRPDLGVDHDDDRHGDRVGDWLDVFPVPAGLIPADVPLAF
jgi:hypothetical protein